MVYELYWIKSQGITLYLYINNETMGLVQFDTQVAWLIPDSKRDLYFQSCDFWVGKQITNLQAWNVYSDPVIVADREFFTKERWEKIEAFMKRCGAKDVTEQYVD